MDKIEINIGAGAQVNMALDGGCIHANQYNSNIECEEFQEREFTEEDARDFPDELVERFRQQLGTRLRGGESKYEIMCKYANELSSTYHSDRRFDVMSIFQSIPRGETVGYTYMDNSGIPHDSVMVRIFYWDAFDKYEVDCKYYQMEFILHDGELCYFKLQYKLHDPDVKERLVGFRRVKEVLDSQKIGVYLKSENRAVEFEFSRLREKWAAMIEKTEYWIDQMLRLSEIEAFYKIRFHLPENASEDEQNAIFMISDAIRKEPNVWFPPLLREKGRLSNVYDITEELELDLPETEPVIQLFGYQFVPVRRCIMKCRMVWSKKKKVWDTKEGGIPGRVEYVCCKG